MTTIGEFFGIAPEPWMVDALCAQTDPEAFYPDQGERSAPAKKVCAACEVRLECLRYALDSNDQHGIYGGMTSMERRRLRRRQAAAKRRAA